MKLVFYLLKKFVGVFLVSLVFIAIILNLVDLFMNITKYLELNVPINDVLKIMLLYVPKTIWYAGPIAFLFSITYILSDLYANNEMTAIFASGISLYRFVAPLIIISVIFSFGLFYLEDKLVVSTLEQKNDLQETLLGTKEDADNSNIIVLSDNGKITYKANRYDDSKRQLRTLYCIFRTEEKKLDSIIYSDSAKWNEEKQLWELQKPVQYKKTDDSLKLMPVDTQLLLLLNEPYDIFRKKIENVESMTSADAKIYIEHQKKAGLPYAEPLSVYYKKFAFSFIFIISGLLAIGLTGKTRKNVLLISLSLSILAVVLYYVFQLVTMVLAKTEVIPPAMGAWLPNFVFITISVLLLKYSRT